MIAQSVVIGWYVFKSFLLYLADSESLSHEGGLEGLIRFVLHLRWSRCNPSLRYPVNACPRHPPKVKWESIFPAVADVNVIPGAFSESLAAPDSPSSFNTILTSFEGWFAQQT